MQPVFSQSKDEKINWISFSKAQELNKTHPKKFLVDVYTEWCTWCKTMDATTYSNKKLAAYINEHFYPVKFNAESRDEIDFMGNTYQYSPQYKVNTLAIALLHGQLAFPSTVFLDQDFQHEQVIQGYQKTREMRTIVIFFGNNIYKKESFEQYRKSRPGF